MKRRITAKPIPEIAGEAYLPGFLGLLYLEEMRCAKKKSVRVSPGGQTTIPVAIRRLLKLQSPDEVIFELSPTGAIEVRRA